ncbi:MAG: lasso peptide biosynthesis B2 protein [Sphingopyxis sp.]|uniref:lasso peptide biosynthesis B2 protein n=1 Tax=Sphingopyxis sp. TaxID=1908224 RepID=UPI002ABCD84F|nr:lasso peptide biosynthesis B2 protein [Sphingopyxis sp.]MDZ3831949.1 lasso peptide biosynthesis B2 protein [Sphingopyxis sp.]
MSWALAPGIGYCETGGELVFLDLARDRYFALRGADRASFERLRAGEPNDSEAMTSLVRSGLLARAEGGRCLDPANVDVAGKDLAARDDGFGIGAGISATRALYWARRAMRPSQIAGTIARLAEKKRTISDVDDESDIISIAARYAASRWIAPISPRCLVDALALDHILLARNLRATLVFGVRTHPFAAHSWLQTPSTVLTGTAAEARNFTPILVVG